MFWSSKISLLSIPPGFLELHYVASLSRRRHGFDSRTGRQSYESHTRNFLFTARPINVHQFKLGQKKAQKIFLFRLCFCAFVGNAANNIIDISDEFSRKYPVS